MLLQINKKIRFSLPIIILFIAPHSLKSTTSKLLTMQQIKNSHGALDKNFLNTLASYFNIPLFIESGTWVGKTVNEACSVFNEIHSIELSQNLYEQAKDYFRNNPKVHLYCGDSSKILPLILPSLKGRMLFWLDGHYSCGATAKGDVNTPIVQELCAIKNAGIKDSIIMIDDIRHFHHPAKGILEELIGYPDANELITFLYDINKDYQIYIMGDMMIAFPLIDGWKCEVSPLLQACTMSRLYDGKNYSLDQIINAEKIIASAVDEERKSLKKIVDRFREYGCQHYHLWSGLMLEHEQKYEDACREYMHALEKGLIHSRIFGYFIRAANKSGNANLEQLAMNILIALNPIKN